MPVKSWSRSVSTRQYPGASLLAQDINIAMDSRSGRRQSQPLSRGLSRISRDPGGLSYRSEFHPHVPVKDDKSIAERKAIILMVGAAIALTVAMIFMPALSSALASLAALATAVPPLTRVLWPRSLPGPASDEESEVRSNADIKSPRTQRSSTESAKGHRT